tara:strand:- start:113 stop:1408 length:1296 start_codon:yes stop_codon:yes gene_type:complete
VKRIKSWNNYPKVKHESIQFLKKDAEINFNLGNYLVHGLGRSYGDVCLNKNGNLILTSELNQIIEFDRENGVLRCNGGISLKEILNLIAPSGCFLPIVPGTRNVTLGGAIANDIHGKNHHGFGSFGNFVNNFQLMRSNGEVLNCSKNENQGYFESTIGGLGLTGIIISAEIRLLKINSQYIDVKTVRYDSLEEFWEINQESEKEYDYTVSWVDCLAKNSTGLRGIFHAGNHSKKQLSKKNKNDFSIPVPFTPPISLVNNLSMKIINEVYYKINKNENFKLQHYKSFFFPLDIIGSWGRAYGPKGFFQYQFVIPDKNGKEGLKKILYEIKNHGQVPALGVLKTFGNIKSVGMMSFPRKGITMALDFQNKGKETLKFLDRLDSIVMEYEGALYPAKDARMSKEVFNKSFPYVNEFVKYIDPKFSSSFWERVNK